MAQKTKQELRMRRHARLRKKIAGTVQRPRLCVFRSNMHIYAQIIDDSLGRTLVAASSGDRQAGATMEGKTKIEQAEMVGQLVAERALNQGIQQVVFDRGGFHYHGRVQALADAARKAGLDF
ncbi:MAG: 50S ribosomal protein L18 [Chloroflexaceae bacterium]|nr:50S ribosomal protein L18 [Chloroflexaceae bacterium]